MGIDLSAIISQIGKDKGIDKDVLVEAVESAMLSAARKHYGHNLNLETQYDEDNSIIEVIQFKSVVDKVEDDGTQISIDEARAEYDAEAMAGDEFGKKLDTKVLGRIAAQTAKQVILQKVRDAEKNVIYNEYKDCKGDLVNGIVQRQDRSGLIINLGRTEAVIPRREQIPKERYRQGDRVRGMILDVDPSARGPQIIITRSHPDFLNKLFELEVPEINEDVIEIKGTAREPGERAKIAVRSVDGSIDPVGACVGIKGSRVHAVVQELRGEKIDIIPWTPDFPSYVARALSPAEVSRVVVDEDSHSMEVIVADDQLSYAIGRRGQNVKLASKLTGWKLDVRSVTVAEEEAKVARAAISSIPGMQVINAERLFQEGYRSVKDIAEDSLEDLLEIEGLTAEVASEILKNAKEHLNTLELQGDSEEEVDELRDLDSLMLESDIKKKLVSGGFDTIQSIVEANDEALETIEGLEEAEVEMVQKAVKGFFTRANLKPEF